ncbi:MAG TPA: lipid-A-disaccharide synthase [Vicinamibacterales bacterium]|jgi:lipid-A-disaccharide synthase|nr:lipid-A-disaccharide synthase [Vicinamibacterales bacterium]
MISCGEPSGDLYAGALATEIRRLDPGTTIVGLGGRRLRDAGAHLTADFSGLSVTGLLEVARLLPRTYATYRTLVREAKAHRPDVFVAIDFPDFNFVLARAIRRLGVPVVYYISPQLWAWRRGRMKTMRRIADRVLVIFPFEEAIYREAGVPVQWVGHPLLDITPATAPPTEFLPRLGLDPARPVVALLPGSRRNEVDAILLDLVRAAALIRQRLPGVQFIVARAPHLNDSLFAPLDSFAGTMAIVEGRTDDVLATADMAVVASGTVTVQAALHECPMVVVYRLSPVTYRLGKPFVHVDTYAMANLVAGRRVVPELIQQDFTPERVADEALRVLTDPAKAAAVKRDLRDVRTRLGTRGASQRAAQSVLDVAGKR